MEPPRVIDLHSHVTTPACQELVEGLAPPLADPFAFWSGEETKAYNAAHFAAIVPQLTDPARRLADMDRMGITIQALSVAPPQYYYWTDPGLGRRLARRQNEHLAALVAGHPDRFVGLATVPLQDVDAAVAELGVVVLLHPHGFTEGRRLMDYYLTNVIGNPLESTIAVSRLIHGGVLEELPSLRLCVVHGGGYLPFYASRMDHAWRHRPEGRHHIPDRPPSSYLRRIYVDCLVYDPAHLAFLIQQMGPDRVVVGTDYPYDMGYDDPVGLVEATPGLAAQDRARILGGTAATLLGLNR